jgi:hypothetical protein
MALGGAWVGTVLTNGLNGVRWTGRTFAVAADAAILGLAGDVGADTGFTMPAGWPTTREVGLTAAQIHAATQVAVRFLTNPSVGATGAVAYFLTRGAAPWRITFTIAETPTVAAVQPEIDVIFLNSSIR